MNPKLPRHPKFRNLTGRKFGKLTVTSYIGGGIGGSRWSCLCDCGESIVCIGTHLNQGHYVQCKQCRHPQVKPDNKTCSSCHKNLPFTSKYFPSNQQHPFGLRARCRQCVMNVVNAKNKVLLRKLRLQILQHYSGSETPFCICCNESNFEFLALDHIEGGSQEDYRKHKNSWRYFRSIVKDGFPPKFRVLCHNCNQCCRIYGQCVHNPEIKFHKPMRLKPTNALVSPSEEIGQTQACIHCGRIFPISNDYFYKHCKMPSGFLRSCKDCDRLLSLARKRKLKESQKKKVFSHYCNGMPACSCCGIAVFEFLSIDHINGGGVKHRKQINTGNTYHWLIKNSYPEGFQILCFNCNQAKGYYGYCPHQGQNIS